jgi:DNA-binding SARP family transcriptional activator/tetratricopeptide (TPR) repeat protein
MLRAAMPPTGEPSGPRLLLSRAPLLHRDDAALALAPLDGALLAWLALEGPTPRARLAALLWPDKDGGAARNSLRQRLFHLRRQTGVELVVGGALLALAPGLAHDLDDADTLLEDGVPAIGAEFDGWIEQQRARRCDRYRQSLLTLCEMAEGVADWPDAIGHAQELLALSPLSEPAHRRLMRLHYLAGDPGAALLAFDRCEHVLKHDVGTRPSAETLALLATIEQTSRAAATPPAAAALPVTLPLPASVLRPPRLVGRDAECAALARVWHDGRVALVVSEAGGGKTRLLQQHAASGTGIELVQARPGDAGVPFATLARMLRAVLDRTRCAALTPQALPEPMRRAVAPLLPELGPTAGGVVLGPAAAGGQRLLLQRAVQGLLQQAQGLAGVLLDDAHWADDASLEMLLALIGDEPAESGALRWALACRPAGGGAALRALQRELDEAGLLQMLPLPTLGPAALAELVDSLALPEVDGAVLAPALHRRTGGNPMFVLETLKHAWSERRLGAAGAGLPLPSAPALRALVGRRVAELSPPALALARVAAIAGVDHGIALAEQVLQQPAIALADAVAELEAAQVMLGNGFAHDLVAEAVHDGVPATIARHVHGQVAAWLEDHGGEPARIAGHWIAAGRPLSALPALRRAAEAARRALRFHEAIGFLEQASRIEGDDGRHCEAFDTLLAAATQGMDIGIEAAVGDAWLARLRQLATTPRQRLQADLLHAETQTRRGDAGVGIALGQATLAAAVALGDTRLQMQCCKALGDACTVASRFEEAARHMQACIGWFDAESDGLDRAYAHGGLGLVLDNLGRSAEALPHHERSFELSVAAADLQNASVVAVNVARNRIFVGELNAAFEAIERGRRLLEPYDGAGQHLPVLQMTHALLLCHLGRYDEALEQAGQGLRAALAVSAAHGVMGHVRLAACWWQLGQWARLAQALAAAATDGSASVAAQVGVARLRWAYAGAVGGGTSVAEAARALRQVLAAMPAHERPDLRLPLRLDVAAAAATEGPAGVAAALGTVDAVAEEAARLGYANVQLAAMLRGASIAAATVPARARRDALAALALHHRGVTTTAVLPAELWLQTARGLQAAGDRAHAADIAAEGRAWLLEAQQRMAPARREAFVERQPVNAALLALAASLERPNCSRLRLG